MIESKTEKTENDFKKTLKEKGSKRIFFKAAGESDSAGIEGKILTGRPV
ncbi:MAG TPA: hypothetical protein PL048_16760 [Leptospiraceae bacterium]|nr:hypothetical protein [Leptospiraceae bacterium]